VTRFLAEINRLAEKHPVSVMEVCGTHTVAVHRSGLLGLLPENLRLISGPGCPVCVTAEDDIYRFCLLSRRKDVIITTFGDLIRVPAGDFSLEKERSAGADIRVVYSPADALLIAENNPDRKVIFLGVGFETTVAPIAATILEAEARQRRNFFVLPVLKTIPVVMDVLLQSPKVKIDGFLCPGHVSTIIGAEPYRFIPEKYLRPAVITGFSPEDILEGLLLILRQIDEGKPTVEIQYRRAVSPEGNRKAQELMNCVFQPAEANWRGLGKIPGTGLVLRERFREFDAELFPIGEKPVFKRSSLCRCGEVLTGVIRPDQCRQFGKNCTPEKPLGPCMVSSEGACAAVFRYGGASGGVASAGRHRV